MAANSLGNASLVLSTAGGELVAGLAKAKGDISRWADGTARNANSKLGKIGGEKGGVGGGMLAGLGKAAAPLAAIVAGAIGV